MRLFQIALVIDDYDRAIEHYTRDLGVQLIEDTPLSPEKRWVVVDPGGAGSCRILLAKAKNGEQASRIGNQTGGRVFLFLHTDDLDRDHQRLLLRGITIVREPKVEEYGKVLVFRDAYGNLWDLIEPPAGE